MPPEYAVRDTSRRFPSTADFRTFADDVRQATGKNLLLSGRITASASTNRGNIGCACIVLDATTLPREDYCVLSTKYPSLYSKRSASWPHRPKRPTHPAPIRASAWIAASVWGPPPPPRGPRDPYEVTHICGNEACVTAKHIRYQPKSENKKDTKQHRIYNHDNHRVSNKSWGVNEVHQP